MAQPVLTQYAVPVGMMAPQMAPAQGVYSRPGHFSPRDTQLAMVILVLFLVIVFVFYASRRMYRPDCRECPVNCAQECPPKAPFVGSEMVGNAWVDEPARLGY